MGSMAEVSQNSHLQDTTRRTTIRTHQPKEGLWANKCATDQKSWSRPQLLAGRQRPRDMRVIPPLRGEIWRGISAKFNYMQIDNFIVFESQRISKTLSTNFHRTPPALHATLREPSSRLSTTFNRLVCCQPTSSLIRTPQQWLELDPDRDDQTS
ncbi:hypothetical protein CROQUDRAFT_96234 [Cronartium quercuum f. sp. fusiforme G11]|uniref:Uncharacterized protein n=1 Tax=Cronartium quercuum f. sp. fusiforme G11 TaxID=708437 RepID=A0A9P6NGZ6_9BASI|nr:hypothetical protein CROQUDRAFT_96234 [Cronartium quercuum f. sp. fusiforme G11]